MIVVTSGAWEGTTSAITAINEHKQTVTIEVEMFGRATSVEINFLDIKKAQQNKEEDPYLRQSGRAIP